MGKVLKGDEEIVSQSGKIDRAGLLDPDDNIFIQRRRVIADQRADPLVVGVLKTDLCSRFFFHKDLDLWDLFDQAGDMSRKENDPVLNLSSLGVGLGFAEYCQ